MENVRYYSKLTPSSSTKHTSCVTKSPNLRLSIDLASNQFEKWMMDWNKRSPMHGKSFVENDETKG